MLFINICLLNPKRSIEKSLLIRCLGVAYWLTMFASIVFFCLISRCLHRFEGKIYNGKYTIIVVLTVDYKNNLEGKCVGVDYRL